MRSVRGRARQYQRLTRKKPDRVGAGGGVGFALTVAWSPTSADAVSVSYDNPDEDDASTKAVISSVFSPLPTPPEPYVVTLLARGFESGPGPYFTEPVALNDKVQLVYYGVLFYSLESVGWEFSDVGTHPDVGTLEWAYASSVCGSIDAATGVGVLEGLDGSGGTVAPIVWQHEEVTDGGGCAWIVLGFEGFDATTDYDADACPGGWTSLADPGETFVVTVARMPGVTPVRFNEPVYRANHYNIRGEF